MSAEVLRFPNLATPIVYVLSGRSGIGKTRLLSYFAGIHPTGFSYHLPMKLGERFSHRVDFTQSPVVAIDELLHWHQSTMPKVIRDLERQALIHGGRLILVVQDKRDLLRSGYSLVRSPAHIVLTQPNYSPADLRLLPAMPR